MPKPVGAGQCNPRNEKWNRKVSSGRAEREGEKGFWGERVSGLRLGDLLAL